MLQFSVYARYCASEEMAVAYRGRILPSCPPKATSGCWLSLTGSSEKCVRSANSIFILAG